MTPTHPKIGNQPNLRFSVAIQRCVWRLAVASRGLVVAAVWGSLFGDVGTSLSGVQNCQGLQCLCVALLRGDVYSEGVCAGKASVYLSKRINSSLLTKIFIVGIGWEGCETQRAIIGGPLLFIVRWVIRNKAWFKHNYKTMWCMESPHDKSMTNLAKQFIRSCSSSLVFVEEWEILNSTLLSWWAGFSQYGSGGKWDRRLLRVPK